MNFVAKTLLLLCLLVSSSYAHSGPTHVASPVSEIKIDGDLSDWGDLKPYPIAVPYLFDGKPNTKDFTGRIWVGFDYEHDVLYVAVDIEDDEIILENNTDNWNSRDTCEIFLAMRHAEGPQVPLQFVYRDRPIVAEADKPNTDLKDSYEVIRLQEDNHLVYEWRIDLGALPKASKYLKRPAAFGFDVGYVDLDGNQEVAVFSTSPGSAKHLSSETLSDLLIPGRDVPLVDVSGTVRMNDDEADESGDTEKKFPSVAIRSKTESQFYVQVPCDESGEYSAQLPAGEYVASLVDSPVAPVAEMEGVPFRVVARRDGPNERLTIPTLEGQPPTKPNLIDKQGILLGDQAEVEKAEVE